MGCSIGHILPLILSRNEVDIVGHYYDCEEVQRQKYNEGLWIPRLGPEAHRRGDKTCSNLYSELQFLKQRYE
jgi:hypothetical protein